MVKVNAETRKAACDLFAELASKGEQEASRVAAENGTEVTQDELTLIVRQADAQVRETYGFGIRDLFV